MGRNRNGWRVVIAVGLVALLGLPIAGASASPTSVPFMEDATGVSFTVTSVNGPLVSGVETDVGQATHFGTVFVTFNVVLDFSTPLATFSGTATELTANGDLVYESRTGMFTSANTVVQYITYTGGTGRFQDLTGSAIMHASISPTGVLTQEITGTISY
jgi:hypothetical protein